MDVYSRGSNYYSLAYFLSLAFTVELLFKERLLFSYQERAYCAILASAQTRRHSSRTTAEMLFWEVVRRALASLQPGSAPYCQTARLRPPHRLLQLQVGLAHCFYFIWYIIVWRFGWMKLYSKNISVRLNKIIVSDTKRGVKSCGMEK